MIPHLGCSERVSHGAALVAISDLELTMETISELTMETISDLELPMEMRRETDERLGFDG